VDSAEELAWLGSVPRTLTIDVGGQTELPASVPPGFHGNVEMAAPQLFVDVSVKKTKQTSSSDDGGSDDSNEESGTKFTLNFLTANS